MVDNGGLRYRPEAATTQDLSNADPLLRQIGPVSKHHLGDRGRVRIEKNERLGAALSDDRLVSQPWLLLDPLSSPADTLAFSEKADSEHQSAAKNEQRRNIH